MTQQDACTILDLIECATDGNWPDIRNGLEDIGYNGAEVAAATGALAKLAHRSNPISAGDF